MLKRESESQGGAGGPRMDIPFGELEILTTIGNTLAGAHGKGMRVKADIPTTVHRANFELVAPCI